MDDTALVMACVEGNPKAQKMLFDRFAQKMLAVSLRYMRNMEAAEDVLQDGFVKVFTKLKDYNHSGSLEGWIRRIIVNTALDQIRKNAKFMDDVNVDDVEYKLDQSAYIEEGLNANDLMKMIQSMPDGYRVVFNMFAIEGFSHKEIAESLGVTESTSKSQYSRARAYLKERISTDKEI